MKRNPLLFALARKTRDLHFPEKKVEVRSVIEISNTCVRDCLYCNMARSSKRERYRIDPEAFEQIVASVYLKGRRVILLQSGENPAQSFVDYVCRCVERVKARFSDLLVILCLGNLRPDQYRRLRKAGAERYILKFETANPALYEQLKPGDSLTRRLACIEHLLSAGFAVGTGNIVGLPGQTLEDIAADLLLVQQYPLSMVSCTAFIPSEDSCCRDEPMGSLDRHPCRHGPDEDHESLRAHAGHQFPGKSSAGGAVPRIDGRRQYRHHSRRNAPGAEAPFPHLLPQARCAE